MAMKNPGDMDRLKKAEWRANDGETVDIDDFELNEAGEFEDGFEDEFDDDFGDDDFGDDDFGEEEPYIHVANHEMRAPGYTATDALFWTRDMNQA